MATSGPDADRGAGDRALVGPAYFRLMFGGEIGEELADEVVDSVLRGFRA